MIEKAQAAKSAEELLALVKKNEIEMTEDAAVMMTSITAKRSGSKAGVPIAPEPTDILGS